MSEHDDGEHHKGLGGLVDADAPAQFLPVIEVNAADGWASINVIHGGGFLPAKVRSLVAATV